LLTKRGLPFYTFYTETDKPFKTVNRHFPGNCFSEHITVALQKLVYDVISVKQMTTKCPTPEGGVIHISFPFFLLTLARNPKAQEIFKLTSLQYG
jgi:hypothetical protein